MRTVRAALALTLLLAAGALAAPASGAASTATVRGTVTVTGGAPLDKAYVRLVDPRLEPDPEPRQIDGDEADARGRFSMAGVPSGSYELAVEDLDGRWQPRVVPVTVSGGTVTVDVRLAAGRTVTGTVVRVDGRPAVGAVVTLWDDSLYSWVRHTVTGRDGRFVARGLTARPHRGTVDPETAADATFAPQCLGGYYVPRYNWYDPDFPQPDPGPGCDARSRVVDVTAGDASIGTETLRHRNAFVTGTVRDAGGRPVAGAAIEVRSFYQADNDFDAYPSQRTRSDARGRYRVMVDEDASQRVSASAKGFSTPASAPAPTPGLGRTASLDLRLRATPRLTVTVASKRKQQATLRVRVAPRAGTGTASGTVTVRYKLRNGKAATRTATLDRTGTARLTVSKARSGRRTFTVRYSGSPSFEAGRVRTSARVR
ncbi:carboxypeptidase regulatory-like domain-containing protein [Solicola sp. PLA-1-18]|uniref:carboxypeptidase regulatory-like domain-containing protein n=1 Tax=Solicola sp. PLA-1-18 TaxID=3380532 RepID=UPI003B7AF917